MQAKGGKGSSGGDRQGDYGSTGGATGTRGQ